MINLAENDQLLALIRDRSRWGDDFPADLTRALRTHWTIDWVNSISTGHPWGKVSKSAAIPIGLIAIRGHSHYGVLSVMNPKAAEQVEAAAVLPGDERLYSAVQTQVGGSYVTALFLARLVSDWYDGPYHRLEWAAGDIAFQITGYPMHSDVRRFMKDTSDWWRTYSGMRLPSGGRRRVPVTHQNAVDAYQYLWDQSGGFDVLTGTYEKPKKPGNEAVVEELQSRGFQIEISTFYTRISEWRADGETWPPIVL